MILTRYPYQFDNSRLKSSNNNALSLILDPITYHMSANNIQISTNKAVREPRPFT